MSSKDLMDLYAAKLALLEEMEEILAQGRELSLLIQETDETIAEFSADEE